MAHFAQIIDGIVTNVIVVHNNELLVDGSENEQKGKDFCFGLFGGEWIQTSYNSNIRKQYAGVGFSYDPVRDEFISLKPFPSWILDDKNDWQSPVARPSSDGLWSWNEDTQEWTR